MAELDAKRSKRLLWPWIVALVVLVASAWLGWSMTRGDGDLSAAESAGPAAHAAAPAVDAPHVGTTTAGA